MPLSRLVFWKDSIWGVGAKYIIPIWAILQGAVFIRDEWFASAAGQYRLGDLLPRWPWYGWVISWLVILLVVFMEGSYRVYTTTNKKLDDLLTPKIRIEHSPTDIGPPHIDRLANEDGGTETITQCRVRLVNESADPMPGMDMLYVDFQVLTPEPEAYTVSFEGVRAPATLTPLEDHPAGVILEIVARTRGNILYGGVDEKRIVVQAFSPLPRQPVKGKEFLITLRAQGERTVPSPPKTYKFGDRDGKLFFEEYHANGS